MQELQPGDPLVIGPYRLLGQLGSGGMGRVFLGLSAGGRHVAVKVIRPELAANPEFRARFQREVAVARTVSGMFTAVVVDADTDAPAPWLATAYVAGPSLAQAVDARGPLSADAVLTLAAGLAESLAAIHAAGLVHRDLKPSNVLLAEDGPRVIDFGISRAAEATSLTSTGLVIGSPGFMSPEQAEGGVVGPPSDMFSLGAVLAFAASGEAPFGSGSTPALIYRVVHGAPDLNQVPARVRPLIERCMAKAPGERPSADDLLVQIGPVQPVTGWRPEAVVRPAPRIQPQTRVRSPVHLRRSRSRTAGRPPPRLAQTGPLPPGKGFHPPSGCPPDPRAAARPRSPSRLPGRDPPSRLPGRLSRDEDPGSECVAALAWPLAALLLVLVVTVFALNASGRLPTGPGLNG